MDYIASALGLYGTYLLGNHNRWGWVMYAISSSMLVYIGIDAGLIGVAIGQAIYVILEIRGWWRHK